MRLHFILPIGLSLAMASNPGCSDSGKPTEPAGESVVQTTEYARWANGPSADTGYFPIAVWLQSPANAPRYKEAGINLFVGLWKGPTEEQLVALTSAGMRVICSQNEVGLAHMDDPIIAAWMHGDEPDNAQPLPGEPGRWGGAVDPLDIQADYARIRERDPSGPVWLNLGQGVANEEWVGRAAPYEDYPRYVEGTDIISFDVYPVSGIRKADGERFLWYVAKGVDSLRTWSRDGQIAWNVIETTRINADRGPTPHQVRAEVWMSLIHGTRGIIYFAHEWNPVFREARLLEDAEMLAAVTDINAEIQSLAPVLNSPTIDDMVAVTSSADDVPIDAMGKKVDDSLYIFALPMRMGTATTGSFALSEALDGSVDVLGEGRQIPLRNGMFSDDFAEYEVHLYRVDVD